MNKLLYINFDLLSSKYSNIENLKENILNIVSEKFSNTNVFVTSNKKFLENMESESFIKRVFVHDTKALDLNGELALGQTLHDDISEVNLSDVENSDDYMDLDLIDKSGLVVTHEAGHLFLPSGHSSDGLNIMNNGPDISMTKITDINQINFTDAQKELMQSEHLDPNYSLNYYEKLYYYDQNSMGSDEIDHDDGLDDDGIDHEDDFDDSFFEDLDEFLEDLF